MNTSLENVGKSPKKGMGGGKIKQFPLASRNISAFPHVPHHISVLLEAYVVVSEHPKSPWNGFQEALGAISPFVAITGFLISVHFTTDFDIPTVSIY
jgi:hypothetical protein